MPQSEKPIEHLKERIARGEVIILDGATGTELQRRGAPMDELCWSATAIVTLRVPKILTTSFPEILTT